MNLLDLRDDEFEERVLRAQHPVLVEFWAPWCGPCRAIAPVVGEAIERFGGRVRLLKVNTDECEELPQRLDVTSIPTLILFVRGEEAARFVGKKRAGRLFEEVERTLAGVEEAGEE